ncbi:MAG: hypothetical protein HN919_12610 [Verrucomicrobia bacterium]|nr:hypothetical protein [Verrucomicrobiota bacterium]
MTGRRNTPKAPTLKLILSGLLIALFSITTQAHARCGVTLVGHSGGETSKLSFLAYGYPNGIAQTFKSGNLNLFQKFENLQNLAKGDLRAAAFAIELIRTASPSGSLYEWASQQGLDALLEETTGVDIDAYISPVALYERLSGSGVKWDQVGWNDRLEEIHFASIEDGGCEGAAVVVWKDTDFRGPSEIISYERDEMVHISSLAMGKEVSSYSVFFDGLKVNDVWTTGGYVDVTTNGDDVFIARPDGRLIGRRTHDRGGITSPRAISSDSDGNFYSVEGSSLNWYGNRQLGPTAVQVDAGYDQRERVYFIGNDSKLYLNGTGRLDEHATAKQIAGGPNGEVYFVGKQHGYLNRLGAGRIHQITARDVAVREDGVVFFIGSDGAAHKYDPADGNSSSKVWGGGGYDLRHIAVRGNIIAMGDGNNVVIAEDLDYPTPRPIPELPERVLPPSTFENLGPSTLPTDFAIEADVTINTANSWGRVFEIGYPEHANQAPLRLQALDEGGWYIAVGDGSSYSDESFRGKWTVGTPFSSLCLV